MNETIFGSLSTDANRLAYVQAQTAGFTHRSRLHPLAPGPQDVPLLTATVQLPQRIARLECVVSLPETAVYPLTRGKTEWDTLNWAYVQTWETTLPPQPAGTLVRYRLRAYPADGSDPIWADDGATFSYLVDEMTLEVTISKGEDLNRLFAYLSSQDIHVKSMRNKSNRLEELFVRLVEQGAL